MKLTYTKLELAYYLSTHGVEHDKALAIAEAIEYQEENMGEELAFADAYAIDIKYSTRSMKTILQETDLEGGVMSAMNIALEEYDALDDAQLQEWVAINIDIDDVYPESIGFFNGFLVCSI